MTATWNMKPKGYAGKKSSRGLNKSRYESYTEVFIGSQVYAVSNLFGVDLLGALFV
jgi:hypothetical protein